MSEFKACNDCGDPEACKLAMGCALEEWEDALGDGDDDDESDELVVE